MKTVMIINNETDKLESTYEVKDENVKSEITELKKIYNDVTLDQSDTIVVWK